MTDVYILRGETMKSGDTMPTLRAKLLEDGDPFNLDGYTVTITVKRSDADSPVVDEASTTVENDGRGIVTYDWSSGETDESGTYLIEFVASDGTDEITFPNDTSAKLYIEDRL